MRTAILAVSVLASGCVPVVQHGPWVRDGYSGSVGGSAVAVTDFEFDEGNRIAPLISFDGGMRWGFANSDSTSDGFALGVQVPLLAFFVVNENDGDSFFSNFLQFINFDGYIATRLSDELDGSFGITASSYHTMPYAQLGKYDKWYTTQAVVLTAESMDWMWSPSFTWVQRGRGNMRTHFSLNGAIASGEDELIWMAGFSIMFEMVRARH
jgi:hypothetical protein